MKSIQNRVLAALSLFAVLLLSGCSQEFTDTLGQAGLNTLMGVGIVFLMLLFMSLVISLFGLINKAENALKNRNRKKGEEPAPAAPAPVQTVEEDVTDDTELVAVIAAAIAAYEGTSADGLMIRSIRRVSSASKWKRG